MAERDSQDRALVEGLRRGDAYAVEELMARHGDRIRRVVTPLLTDAREADRVARDVLTRVARNIGAYTGSPAFAIWVYRTALEVTRERWQAGRGHLADATRPSRRRRRRERRWTPRLDR